MAVGSKCPLSNFQDSFTIDFDSFVPTYIACGGTETEAYDFMFANKILKKFESLNIAFLREELEELINYLDKLYGKGKFPRSQEVIRTLLKNN